MKIKLLIDLTDVWGGIHYHTGEIVDGGVDIEDNGKKLYCFSGFYLREHEIEEISEA